MLEGLRTRYAKPRAGRMVKKLADAVLRFNVKAPVAWVKRIEDWRRHQPGLPSRSAAIRQLVSEALDHYDKKKKKAKDC
jgi:metal-responsive CopG/Arc/MetJ family transcriptional regulator